MLIILTHPIMLARVDAIVIYVNTASQIRTPVFVSCSPDAVA